MGQTSKKLGPSKTSSHCPSSGHKCRRCCRKSASGQIRKSLFDHLGSRRSDCAGTCGKHRSAGRQHHRHYCHCGIGTRGKTYRATYRGDAKTVHPQLRCIAIILGRCKKNCSGCARGNQSRDHFCSRMFDAARTLDGVSPKCRRNIRLK